MSEEVQQQSEYAEIITVDSVIEKTLQKNNITDKIIGELREQYGKLTIAGLEDKEGYNKVKEGRMVCKKLRVQAVNLCKKGREEALKTQKAWVAKEKEVTDKISVVEDYLQEQEDAYNSERDRIKREEEERLEQQRTKRTLELTRLGAVFADGKFTLDDISFDLSFIREVDDEIYNNDILPAFKAIFDKKEQERIEKERQEKEERERLQKEKEEFEKQKAELERKQREQEEKERREREEREREEREAAQKRYEERCDQLAEMQFVFVKKENRFKCYHVMIDDSSVKQSTAAEWDNFISLATTEIAQAKEQAEAQRIEEEKERAETERKKTLGALRKAELSAYQYGGSLIADDLAEMPDEDYIVYRNAYKENFEKLQRERWEAEEKARKEREEQERQEQENKKADTTKWYNYVSAILAVPVPDCRGTFYRKKVVALRSIVDQIKAL